MKIQSIFGLLLISLFLSCGEDVVERDRLIIEDYINTNNLDAESTSDGLYYLIDEPGNEEHPDINSTVTVKYVGRYTDNFIFDQNSQGYTEKLNKLIRGWHIGLPFIGKGGKIKLLVPAHLGYGENPPSGIRESAVLIFDIELVDFM